MGKVFNALSTYYDLIYENKDYTAEAVYVIELISSYKPDAKTMLEFGSGTGIHATIFNERGFDIHGVEPSTEMLVIAKKKERPGLFFQQGNMISYKSDNKFDVATALFHVVSYLNSNEELFSSFINIGNHIKSKGLFIFDAWYSAAVLTQLPEKRIKIVENDLYKVTRHANPVNHWNENVIDVIYDIDVLEKSSGDKQQFSETHKMRHFSIPEIELLAKSTGFDLIKTEEFGTSKIAGPDTWGVSFVLRKK
ncbi:class I SAM-dependent methyltransferase [Pedobacter heparinus]|uniref:class I SAM-dependent DNA methyltransferase n=1 Tax=Pedobacter heparinus TaxID=984 RepID=UPI0029305298|nr:class I SAM-dependent methyltransferase [Pedobacter heparinus]